MRSNSIGTGSRLTSEVDRAAEPEGEDTAHDASDQSEEEAFGQELTNQAAAARAERETHADLAAPGGAATEQEAGDVGAADEQHETGDDRHQADEGKERRERLRHAAEAADAVDAEDFAQREPRGGVGILRREPLADDERCRLRLFRAHAGPEPRDDLERVPAAILQHAPGLRGIDRHPELAHESRRARPAKSARHHADDFERLASELDRPTDDRRIAPKARAPGSLRRAR